MNQFTDETKRRVVREHIQDGRSLSSLAAEYGVSQATVSNRVHAYREECQLNDAEKPNLELMEEIQKPRKEKAALQEENDFLKKRRHSLRRKSIDGISIHRPVQKRIRTPVSSEVLRNLSERVLQLQEGNEEGI